MTVIELMKTVNRQLDAASIEDAAFESRLIVSHYLGISVGMLPKAYYGQAGERLLKDCSTAVQKRLQGIPLQYILGEWEFYGLPFRVTEDVLIPRQDTELICELAIGEINKRKYNSVLDLCTGSGCIGITIAKLTDVHVTAVDISQAALFIARENALKNGVEVDFLQGDLFEPVQEMHFDLIVTNPPYLDEMEMKSLQRECTYEPEGALYGGTDGMTFYRRIAEDYHKILNPGGLLMAEFGYTQGERMMEVFPHGRIFQDMTGNDRVIVTE